MADHARGSVVVIFGGKGMLGRACVASAPPGAVVHAPGRTEGDVTNLPSVREYLIQTGATHIINCAAYTAVDLAESERGQAFSINTCGARNLALAARGAGARLLHVSTDFVFNGTKTTPYDEGDAPDPRGAYAESKYQGELCIQQTGGDWQIARTQWLYGAHGKHFVATIAKLGRERDRLTVVDDQRGAPACTYEVSRHLWKLLFHADGGIYHASGTGECSWREFAAEIVKLSGGRAVVDPITTADWNRMKPGSAPRPAYSVLSKDRLHRAVGNGFPDWRESLRLFFERGDIATSRA